MNKNDVKKFNITKHFIITSPRDGSCFQKEITHRSSNNGAQDKHQCRKDYTTLYKLMTKA